MTNRSLSHALQRTRGWGDQITGGGIRALAVRVLIRPKQSPISQSVESMVSVSSPILSEKRDPDAIPVEYFSPPSAAEQNGSFSLQNSTEITFERLRTTLSERSAWN